MSESGGDSDGRCRAARSSAAAQRRGVALAAARRGARGKNEEAWLGGGVDDRGARGLLAAVRSAGGNVAEATAGAGRVAEGASPRKERQRQRHTDGVARARPKADEHRTTPPSAPRCRGPPQRASSVCYDRCGWSGAGVVLERRWSGA